MSYPVSPPSSPSGGTPLASGEAMAVAAYAARERERAEQLAAVLEGIAEHGYPDPAGGVLWETARDDHLARLAGQDGPGGHDGRDQDAAQRLRGDDGRHVA